MLAVVRNVLVAYDGSSAARRALEHAADLARPGDGMTVVNVMHEPGVSARMEPPSERLRQEEILADARGYLACRGIEARMLAKVAGNAAHEVLAAADHVGADVLVVARRRGPSSHILGSTSSRRPPTRRTRRSGRRLTALRAQRRSRGAVGRDRAASARPGHGALTEVIEAQHDDRVLHQRASVIPPRTRIAWSAASSSTWTSYRSAWMLGADTKSRFPPLAAYWATAPYSLRQDGPFSRYERRTNQRPRAGLPAGSGGRADVALGGIHG
jgi:nucleotide-binding universal stress UspA family protein